MKGGELKMAKKQKIPVTPVTLQKTQSQPTQAASQSPQKDASCGQSSKQTPPVSPKP
jgi:hypothetical protein